MRLSYKLQSNSPQKFVSIASKAVEISTFRPMRTRFYIERGISIKIKLADTPRGRRLNAIAIQPRRIVKELVDVVKLIEGNNRAIRL